MDAASPSNSSKPAKWRHRALGLVAILGFISMCALVEVWILTRNGIVIVSFSKSAQHFELHAGRGHLFAFHISNWWTDSELDVAGGPMPPELNLKAWIGFDIESESRFATCTYATGVYRAPLIDMTNVVITPHFQRGKSLRFRVCLIPIWIPCVVCAIPTVWWLVRRRRHAPAQRSATDSPPTGVESSPRPVSPS